MQIKVMPHALPSMENHGINLRIEATVSCLLRITDRATAVTAFSSASVLNRSNGSFKNSQGAKIESEIRTTPRETTNLYKSPNSNFISFPYLTAESTAGSPLVRLDT